MLTVKTLFPTFQRRMLPPYSGFMHFTNNAANSSEISDNYLSNDLTP
jgi:hypothetical protein